jgi:thioesterase domain-containing protein
VTFRDLNVEAVYTLSPLQQELLARAARTSGATEAVRQAVYQLGPVDEPLYGRAWEQVIERHAVLRTSFHWQGLSKPVQVVHRAAAFRPEGRDWSDLSSDEQAARLAAYLDEDRGRPLALSQPSLMRWTLVRLKPASHYLIWSYHPLILDGDSARLVFAETLAVYEGLRRGQPHALPAPGRFQDYVAWVRARGSAAEAFWRQALQGFAELTPLPEAKTSGASHEGPIQERTERLPAQQLALLRTASETHRVTIGTLLQAGWALLLAGPATAADVVFGLSDPGRPSGVPGADTLAGPLRNTLPIRVHLSQGEPLGPWLRRLHAHVEEARSFGILPLEQVRSFAEVCEEKGLVQTVLAVEPRPTAKSAGLPDTGARQVKPVSAGARRSNYPLVLSGGPEHGGLALRLSYASDCLGADAVGRLLQRYRGLLDHLCIATADEPLGQVAGQTHHGPALVCLHAEGSRPRLFCVPGAGACAAGFEPLARHLGPEQPVYAFEPLGTHGKRRPHTRVADMAACYLEALSAVQPEGPYYLAGHSAGGLVAYEMARQLVGRGQTVALLALFDIAAPHPERPHKPERPRKVLVRLARQIGLELAGRAELRTATAEELLSVVLREARAASQLPPAFGEADLRRRVRLYRAHVAAAHTYVPPPYAGTVTLFPAATATRRSARLGWERLAGAVEVRPASGSHDTMLREPHVRSLARQLAEFLGEIRSPKVGVVSGAIDRD